MRLNKFFKLLVVFVTLIGICFCTSCKNDKVISVCASRLPHADVLENCVADILEKQGYTLEVTILNWTLQNSSVAMGDYDANYFQHIPFLEDYNGKTKLFPVCKVHYEPLGIYRGKSSGNLQEGKTYYFKAYMVLDGKTVWGELRYFTTNGGNGGEPDERDF